ncbi:TRAP transporter TatT component family protein [Thiohalobacter sp. IOR34]|uniref:TRAP transporter TatT component family protein n=1 Tax=Thiohalobacter sp. IOR34 TaxID=3057176 RepID=UPI0025AF4C62|nr:TRAP transporter TatT component family protein [Thiohalobacter sp. IOR34]WJW76555.1 TRAP transporter TatT component family protein [Thiohalobacter sp. IOR34]
MTDTHTSPARRTLSWLLLLLLPLLGGCSVSQVVVRSSMTLMEGGIEAMNRETDLELARAAIPATLKMLDGMLVEDPHNRRLRLYAAEGYYGYSYAFVEPESRRRAAALYRRCFDQARLALADGGLDIDIRRVPLAELDRALAKTGQRAVPALFWSASCWAKWIDMNRDDPRGIARLTRAARLMQRVLELDETFYHGGPHLFFGVYYGARAPMFGGDFEKSARHFARAREISQGRLLMVDVLHAEFLARQMMDRKTFHQRLTAVLETPPGSFPELGFANQVARERARALLAKEAAWF